MLMEYVARMQSRAGQCLRIAGAVLLLAIGPAAFAQAPSTNNPSIELIDPNVLRVCADPRNLPFSMDNGSGFENKLGGLPAKQLNKTVAYVWYPGSTGFVRNTLGAYKCDIIMGIP